MNIELISDQIGRVIATESKPSTVDDFCFWTSSKEILKPFDVIAVEHLEDSITFGIITQIEHLTDASSVLTGFVSNDFGSLDLSHDPLTERLSMNRVSASVLFNTESIALPLIENSRVYKCSKEGIIRALGLEKKERSIPCGIYSAYRGSGGIRVPVFLNSNFLIGPDGAHLNISGISGLGAKTSYATFLLKAIQQFNNENGSGIAMILLNVKQQDLLSIHVPNPNLSSVDRSNYAELGMEVKPFENVRYLIPFSRNDDGSYLKKEDVKSYKEEGCLSTFKFNYSTDHEALESIFSNVEDSTGTMESINSLVCNRSGDFQFCNMWSDVEVRIKEYLDSGNFPIEKASSWNKYYRHFRNTINKSDIFSNSAPNPNKKEVCLTDEINKIKSGDTLVVDIAKLDDNTQGFVFSQIMDSVQRVMLGDGEDADFAPSHLRPKKILLFIDELNKYAGKDVPKKSVILNQILELTERGRSLGTVLFGVEQFRSAIHDRVVGNSSTSAYGRTSPTEISQTIYRHLPKTYLNQMLRLNPGEFIVEHPLFRSAMSLKFPNPVYKKQEM